MLTANQIFRGVSQMITIDNHGGRGVSQNITDNEGGGQPNQRKKPLLAENFVLILCIATAQKVFEVDHNKH